MSPKTTLSRREFLKQIAFVVTSFFSAAFAHSLTRFYQRPTQQQHTHARYYTRADHLAG